MPKSRWLLWLPFAAILCVYALELRVQLMDVDAAEYAHIAQQMFATKSFLVVKNRTWDYLDKPPLTFWLASLSYAAFGVSTAAYKLPSLLFALLAIFSVYRLALLYYDERIAYLAALVLASCTAMFLWTNDVRTDTLLMGSVTFALWQLAEYRRFGRWRNFAAGFVGVGLAMLAKGPIGAMVPVLAVGGEVALKRDWRGLLSPRWLAGALIVLVLLAPMLWGLHQQFGMQGIRFFFWTQSFGRITGESTWKDNTTPLFFTHTLLWELLPWSVFFAVGFFRQAANLLRLRFRLNPVGDGLTLPGFALPFVALSLSHYKLPHYIFVIIPLAAIITAVELNRAAPPKALRVLQAVLLGLIWGLTMWLVLVAFPLNSWATWTMLAASLLVTVALSVARLPTLWRIVGPSVATMVGFAAMLAVHFYPTLLAYQAPTVAAQLLQRGGIPADRVFTYRTAAYSFDFLLQRSVPYLGDVSSVQSAAASGDTWIFTDEQGRSDLESAHLPVVETIPFHDFPVTRLSLLFLRPQTRASRLGWRYLLHLHAGSS